MARIRSIKPEFFESEDVAALPMRARLTWIGLWVHCDNYGRAKDNVKLVKKNVWPLDQVSLKDIEDDLSTLANHGRIVRYSADGKPFLAVTNWHHQGNIPHPGVPKFPPPPADVPNVARHDTDDSSSVKLHVPVSEGSGTSASYSGNREQGTGAPSSPRGDGARFDEFWSVYPRKVGKKAARRKWDAAVKDAIPDTIIAAAKLYAEHVAAARTEDRFIAHPETWLNQGRWDDQLTASETDVSPLWKGAYQ